jgi:pimeloyl-ACP methyl ester carboxylesterase
MTDELIIVIPGITGSALARDGQPVWGLSVGAIAHGLTRTQEVLDSMALPPVGDGPADGRYALTPTGLMNGWHVWPGFWAGPGYGGILRYLREAVPDPAQVLPFPYDWRLSNAHTAALLKTFTEQAIASRREQTKADTGVIFVCHSMGGLIARYYLEVLGGRHIVTKLITLGTPYSGSIKAVRALTGSLAPSVPKLSGKVASVARTFPSVAELLPAYRCAQLSPGADPVLLHGADIPDLPSDLIAACRAFHDTLSAAVAANGPAPYATYAFGGKNQPTDQSITVNAGRVTYNRHQRGENRHGDGTVPCFSALPPDWDRSGPGLFRAARHTSLTKDRVLLDALIDKVNDLSLGEVMRPTDELALDLPDAANPGHAFEITVSTTRANLIIQADVNAIDGTPYDQAIPLSPVGDGTYTTTLELPPGTWHIAVRTPAETPVATIEDIITVQH